MVQRSTEYAKTGEEEEEEVQRERYERYKEGTRAKQLHMCPRCPQLLEDVVLLSSQSTFLAHHSHRDGPLWSIKHPRS